jgi:hypothetical protein
MFNTFLVKTGNLQFLHARDQLLNRDGRPYIQNSAGYQGFWTQSTICLPNYGIVRTEYAFFVRNVIKQEKIENQVSSYLLPIPSGIPENRGWDLRCFENSPVRLMRFSTQYVGMYDYVYKPYPEIVKFWKPRWVGTKYTIGEHLDALCTAFLFISRRC